MDDSLYGMRTSASATVLIREVALLTAHVPAALRASQPAPCQIDFSLENWIQQTPNKLEPERLDPAKLLEL